MSYAIVGPKGAILRITETAPKALGPQATSVEISDEIAATVEAGFAATPRVIYFLEDGILSTAQQRMEAKRIERESAAPAPKKVGSGQIRAAMILSGIAADDDALSTLIEGILANIPDESEQAVAVTLWRNASEFKRDHKFIAAVQAALGKTDADIDQLFRLAATV